jgi:thiol-disulfide isomerase/thioredoxin
VKWQIAPEFRGTLIRQIAAAVACALLALLATPSPGRAGSADFELQSWHGGPRATFVLPASTGPDVALATERGRIVIVHFFASWCEPCREELPSLNRLAERSNDRVRVLAIAVSEVDLRVQRFLETTPVGFPVLFDRERTVAREWGVSRLPTSFILDADLRPRFVVETDFAWDKIDSSKLTMMIAENAGGIRRTKIFRNQQEE